MIPIINYCYPEKSFEEYSYIKSALLGEDFSFIIDEYANAFGFGNNLNGQLGLTNEMIIESPVLLEELKGKIKEIKTNGESNFILTNTNELYFWNFGRNAKIVYKPLKLFLDQKIIVNSISCGKNFCILLTKQGTLFSFGDKNLFGELGSGDFNPRKYPELIYSLAESGEKIVQVECGYKHVLARNGIGKVFSWGNVIFEIFTSLNFYNHTLLILKLQSQ